MAVSSMGVTNRFHLQCSLQIRWQVPLRIELGLEALSELQLFDEVFHDHRFCFVKFVHKQISTEKFQLLEAGFKAKPANFLLQ